MGSDATRATCIKRRLEAARGHRTPRAERLWSDRRRRVELWMFRIAVAAETRLSRFGRELSGPRAGLTTPTALLFGTLACGFSPAFPAAFRGALAATFR